MWDKVKSIVASAAPLVGGLIGGPVGGSVGSLVAHTLGVENTPKAIEAELKRNPDALIKIKQLESDERIALRKLMIEETRLLIRREENFLEDSQDARGQHKDHWMPWALTVILALMVIGMFAALFFGTPPDAYSQVLIMIAGTVLGGFGTAIAFWLGSSMGSQTKSKQLIGGFNVR
ncbi:hypothetical protein GCM10007938_26530 [Vibrio zhanjiangensis]|uniref:Uncharacterized protein n=1 Tax=Vibrio zhanjiangensis TaxID=1046128 RepID=A0ABQ6F1X4_9VIBR|nr:hypothetical protein [Vibrio zhanjiangensis]GLT18871.1 hypothetical protein GCM10007938_26530 [Vibrio zhanjiangensis]